jgi:hypothetical protein
MIVEMLDGDGDGEGGGGGGGSGNIGSSERLSYF